MNSKEIYSILTESSHSRLSFQLYYKNVFQNSDLDWKTIYMLPCIVTKDSRLRVFQYKLLNNVLYLNKMLFRFGKIDSPVCSFCKMIDETPLHRFYNCSKRNLSHNIVHSLSYATECYPRSCWPLRWLFIN